MCYKNAAELLLFLGKPSQAKKTYSDGARAFSPTGRYLSAWATMEKRMGSASTASKLFRAACKVDLQVHFWKLWPLLNLYLAISNCQCLILVGLWQFSLTIVTRGVFMKESTTWLRWAQHESNQGNIDGAIECYKKGLEVFPCCPFLWYGYVTMAKKIQEEDDARRIFQLALNACPR